MIAGTYEEWTVLNRSFSDHPFHIHQNHFLLTKINGKPLATPEWHDTVIVPGSQPQPTGFPPSININTNPIGSITFRIYFNPVTVGCFVAHCHVLTHEDLGMMQRMDILPGPNQPSGCMIDAMAHSKAEPNPRQAALGRKNVKRGEAASVVEQHNVVREIANLAPGPHTPSASSN